MEILITLELLFEQELLQDSLQALPHDSPHDSPQAEQIPEIAPVTKSIIPTISNITIVTGNTIANIMIRIFFRFFFFANSSSVNGKDSSLIVSNSSSDNINNSDMFYRAYQDSF